MCVRYRQTVNISVLASKLGSNLACGHWQARIRCLFQVRHANSGSSAHQVSVQYQHRRVSRRGHRVHTWGKMAIEDSLSFLPVPDWPSRSALTCASRPDRSGNDDHVISNRAHQRHTTAEVPPRATSCWPNGSEIDRAT